eukprot:Skav215128  [mRNA]  locus=scaffold1164:33862:36582:- [translate_table: standard]
MGAWEERRRGGEEERRRGGEEEEEESGDSECSPKVAEDGGQLGAHGPSAVQGLKRRPWEALGGLEVAMEMAVHRACVQRGGPGSSPRSSLQTPEVQRLSLSLFLPACRILWLVAGQKGVVLSPLEGRLSRTAALRLRLAVRALEGETERGKSVEMASPCIVVDR